MPIGICKACGCSVSVGDAASEVVYCLSCFKAKVREHPSFDVDGIERKLKKESYHVN
jgi:hypothetical protein